VRGTDWAAPPNPPGCIRVVVEGLDLVLRLTGEIDAATVGHYEAAAAAGGGPSAAAAAARQVRVVDAGGVTFMNSLGVRFLLHQTEAVRASGRRPVLRRPTPSVRHVLRLTQLDELFEIREA
jgi:anti-sigma B factor antagonist